MTYLEFEKYVSHHMANEWLRVANGHKGEAVRLYDLFQKLSGQMYITIGVLETILRNSIDSRLTSKFGNNWVLDSISANGIFSDQTKYGEIVEIINTAISHAHSNGMKYTHQNVINQLELGFWRYLFYKQNYIATGQCLMKIFINKETKNTDGKLVNQSLIYKELTNINQLRNKIAHYDIAFSPQEALNITMLSDELDRIVKILIWLGCPSPQKLNCIKMARNTINDIKTKIRKCDKHRDFRILNEERYNTANK